VVTPEAPDAGRTPPAGGRSAGHADGHTSARPDVAGPRTSDRLRAATGHGRRSAEGRRADGSAAAAEIPATPPLHEVTAALAASSHADPRRLTIPLAIPAVVLLLPLMLLPFFGRKRF
jgi:hypothetical protein